MTFVLCRKGTCNFSTYALPVAQGIFKFQNIPEMVFVIRVFSGIKMDASSNAVLLLGAMLFVKEIR